MRHAMVTIAAPIAVQKIDAAIALIEELGNPATAAIAAKLNALDGEKGLHFASLHALNPTDPSKPTGSLVLEFSADGEDDEAIGRIAEAVGAELGEIFRLAADWKPGDLAAYLRAHKVKSGFGWNLLAGLPFAGTPGMSVGRIRDEARLAERLRALVLSQPNCNIPALQRLEAVRAEIRQDADLKWALTTPEPPLPTPDRSTLQLIGPLVLSFVQTYLLIPLILVLVYAVATWDDFDDFLGVLGMALVALLLIAAALYANLRRLEESDWLSDRAPDRETVNRILARENHYAQNHMVSLTTLKPGITRMVTIRLGFWIIGQLARLSFKPGHLGEINTIHFARWVQLPGTNDLAFFSNYGGSWESYLEDFPKSENLFQKGATDGERFKRYARQSMVHTPFWHSAYPGLTTSNIRTNARLRRGLAVAMTEEEAALWLAQFGSAERPTAQIESTEVQSLVFGGMGFKPFGEMLVVDLPPDRAKARAWLAEMAKHVAFDDGRLLPGAAVITLGLGPGALAKLGLPGDALASFPPAFLDGMTGPGRLRLLGDDPGSWQTWRTDRPYDAALLVYGSTQKSVDALVAEATALADAQGAEILIHMPLDKPSADRKEPFGFFDGASQPTVRGTYRALRNGDPLHLVEAGEFILGYPDNRGNTPPGPVLDARHDPDNVLPIVGGPDFAQSSAEQPRDLGANGSFLVIRQLEQHVDAFHAYCEAEAKRLKGRMKGPFVVNADLIGAKMIGRWPDGSSLARNPYAPQTKAKKIQQSPTSRPASNPESGAVIAGAPAPADPDQAADNDFLFGAEDPEGLRCPLGAHIRRANPRDSLDPGSFEQIGISNRHRILRVGRSYTADENGETRRGLMFFCLNADIERQFEFVQQTWLRSETFHGLADERDPLVVQDKDRPSTFTIPSRDGPVGLSPAGEFVTPRGGGYFFLPSKRLLRYLSA